MNNILTIKTTILLALTISLFSCETEIPDTDTTPPKFSLKITGDGFDRTFTQDDNFDSFQLNLRTNTDYTFLYSASDQGGMKQMQLNISGVYYSLDYTSTFEAPWNLLEDTEFNYIINWSGNRNNPVTGSILQGAFTTKDTPNGGTLPAAFRVYLADFGGQSANGNITFADLNIQVGNHNTEIKNL